MGCREYNALLLTIVKAFSRWPAVVCRCFSCEFFQWTDAGKPSNLGRCITLPEGIAAALNPDA